MRRVAMLVVSLLLMGGCGGSGSASACSDDVEEPLDPRSTQHLLPGAPEPSYAGDPPTSGPHVVSATLEGAQAQPLPRPAQVALLERGGVLLQYKDLAEEERKRLEAITGQLVVSAPNPDLPSPLVATAWRRRLVCSRVDVPALQAFAARHRGRGPGTA